MFCSFFLSKLFAHNLALSSEKHGRTILDWYATADRNKPAKLVPSNAKVNVKKQSEYECISVFQKSGCEEIIFIRRWWNKKEISYCSNRHVEYFFFFFFQTENWYNSCAILRLQWLINERVQQSKSICLCLKHLLFIASKRKNKGMKKCIKLFSLYFLWPSKTFHKLLKNAYK